MIADHPPLPRAALLVLVVLPLVLAGCGLIPSRGPEVADGLVDLSQTDLSAAPISLKGEWLLYWEQLVTGASPVGTPTIVEVPKSWAGQEVGSVTLPGTGYATYRVRVVLPDNMARPGLKILEISTAAQVAVNGTIVYQAGQVGTDRESTSPAFLPVVIPIDGSPDVLDITALVANFHHREGGLRDPILVGEFDTLQSLRESSLLKDALLFGAILIMGIYHLLLYSSRRDRRSVLWFGLFCVSIATRILVTGERYLTHLIPNVPWELMLKVEYLSFYLAVPVFLLYLKNVFPDESDRRAMWPSIITMLAFSAIVLVTPTRVYSRTLDAFQFVTVFGGVYSLIILIKAMSSHRLGARTILAGFVVMFFTVGNDILDAAEIIDSGHLVSFGLLAFIVTQSIQIARMFNQDFTTIHRQSSDLQEANSIINSSPAVAFRWKYEPGWPVDFASKNVQSLTGYTANELTSGTLVYRDLIDPNDLERVSAEVGQASASEPSSSQTFVHEPYRIVRKDGEVRWVSDRTIVERDADGEIQSYRGIIEDVTELKKATDELTAYREHLEELVAQRTTDLELARQHAEAASVAKSEFLASMSHELRTPLNHILGFTELVADAKAGPVTEEQEEYLTDALSSAKHLLNLINEILDISKVESGTLLLDKGPVELHPLLDGVIRSFREQAADRNMVVECDIDDAPSVVTADAKRLTQILINLLSNAMKFSPDEATIALKVAPDPQRASDGSTLFSISDEGIGIEEADRERIFHSFEQVDSAIHRPHTGTGLGLAICRSLVTLHGGKIWVESDGNDTGSTFSFTIPNDA